MKLNLGCGHRHKQGWVNADKYPPADILHDLEKTPWPWPDNSFDEVVLCHVLEHLGQTPNSFLQIMQELYRICAGGALVTITVPHPRHEFYLNDPTHVRPITPEILAMFSKKQCEKWLQENRANSPLALQIGVDFEQVSLNAVLDPRFEGKSNDEIAAAIVGQNNVICEMTIGLRAVK
ncbi:MAG: methyltransferase domain-containing protein [Bdellovibrionales bacterium]